MRKVLIFAALVVLAFGVVAGLRKCTQSQEEKIEALKANLDQLQDAYVPLKFRVKGRSDDTLRFELEILNAAGDEIAQENFELHGKELNFDIYLIKFNGNYLAFPYKIFTDLIAPDEGIDLLPLYNRNGFPAIYTKSSINKEAAEGIAVIYQKLREQSFEALPEHFGSAVHDIKGLQEFLLHHDYKIVVRKKGGVEIVLL